VSDYETILYTETDGVAWVTMNRPEVHNAFNFQMQRELKDVWRSLRSNDDVRCAVLTGAGEKAFCVGIDRTETMGDWESADDVGSTSASGTGAASVNGMACGGAFYMLGEVEFIIAAEHATFFDPHVTYGMTACFESMHMLQKMPFGEIMRVALLGASERMTARRAHEIGLVSEVVEADALRDAAAWAAGEIAKSQAIDAGHILIRLGSDPASLMDGQKRFASGERVTPRRR
jgi:enoyl-CoA hydratase/carnithine racemase